MRRTTSFSCLLFFGRFARSASDGLILLMEIVAATRNKKKLAELRRMGIALRGLDDFPACPEVEETGSTFAENAILKAQAVAHCTGRPALADDSGLEVYALGGAPGVYSARYAGPQATDSDNVRRLLDELEILPEGQRGARFVCVLALAYPDGAVVTFEGTVEGRVGRKPVGFNGFGYDPVFYPEGTDKTFAQLPPEEKDSMSHRGRALAKFAEYIAENQGKMN